MATHTLVLDNWWPVLVNRLLRLHWAERNRRLKEDAQMIGLRALAQGVPRAVGKRRVSLLIRYRHGGNRPDNDALWKGLLDSCVTAGILVNDDPDWCEQGTVDYEQAPRKGLVVTFEDLE